MNLYESIKSNLTEANICKSVDSLRVGSTVRDSRGHLGKVLELTDDVALIEFTKEVNGESFICYDVFGNYYFDKAGNLDYKLHSSGTDKDYMYKSFNEVQDVIDFRNNFDSIKDTTKYKNWTLSTKLRRAGFDKFYFDDWFDYNYDELKRRFEDFKRTDSNRYKNLSDFAVDLMLQYNGKDLKREKTQEEKDYEKELKSLGINKKEFEEWLSLYEDKALNDYKGDPDKDNNAYMKYLYNLYLNHGDKYMDPENL